MLPRSIYDIVDVGSVTVEALLARMTMIPLVFVTTCYTSPAVSRCMQWAKLTLAAPALARFRFPPFNGEKPIRLFAGGFYALVLLLAGTRVLRAGASNCPCTASRLDAQASSQADWKTKLSLLLYAAAIAASVHRVWLSDTPL